MIAALMEPVGVLDDVGVKLLNLVDECFALFPVGLFKLADFTHYFMRMSVQVFEAVHRDVVLLLHFVNSSFHCLVFVIDLVFQCLHVGVSFRYPNVDLFEDVKLAVCVVNCVFNLFDLFAVFNSFLFDYVH